LHSTKWSEGKKKKGWKPQDSEGNEENGYPVPDPNETKINDPRNPVLLTKTSSKKKSCK
jgi:hypothetical protein